MMRRGCHIPQQGFPAFLPFISLPCLNECVHTSPPIPSLPLHPPPPCLRLRCSARVTPRHCSVISGPRAASSEANQLDVALGARARNGPPSPAFLLSKDPLSLSHREDPPPTLLPVAPGVLVTNYQRIPAGADSPGVAPTCITDQKATYCTSINNICFLY